MPLHRKKNNSRKIAKASANYRQALEKALAHECRQQFNEAESIYRDLLKGNPTDVQVNLHLAQLYRRSGRDNLVLPLLQNALAANPSKAEVNNDIGILFHQIGHPSQARKCFDRALQLSPHFFEARYNLGLALRDLAQLPAAIDCFSEVLVARPDHQPSLLQQGISLRDSDRLEEALAVFKQIVLLDTEHADSYKYMGLIYVDLARIGDAVLCWERVLELEPECSLAYLHLSQLRSSSHDIPGMESLYEKSKKNIDKIYLAFSLGKAFEDGQCYDKSFAYFREGNHLKRMQFRYSIDDWSNFFARLQAIFSRDFLRRFKGVGIDDDTPIFILGMPRSGTSLVEQILASHPKVFGAGELKLLPSLCSQTAQQMGRSFPDFFEDFGVDEWKRLGSKYIDGLRLKNTAARHITDKMPLNFRFVGLLSIILPRAKIIHCQREPIDTCWSIFKNIFAEGNAFAYDLQELGTFYSGYQSLMRYWQAVLPGYFYNLNYELLVSNPQVEISKLLDFCELPFDQRCIDFHDNNRAVNTVSAAQVKRPISQGSLQKWSAFEEYLAPLREKLTPW